MDNNDIFREIKLRNNIQLTEIRYVTKIIQNVIQNKPYRPDNSNYYEIVYKNIKEKNKR